MVQTYYAILGLQSSNFYFQTIITVDLSFHWLSKLFYCKNLRRQSKNSAPLPSCLPLHTYINHNFCQGQRETRYIGACYCIASFKFWFSLFEQVNKMFKIMQENKFLENYRKYENNPYIISQIFQIPKGEYVQQFAFQNMRALLGLWPRGLGLKKHSFVIYL